MKFLEVLSAGFDFRPGIVVARSLKALETSDHLGFCWLSYESDHLVKSALVEESILVFSLRNFEKLVLKVCISFLEKKTKSDYFLIDL